MTRVYTCMYILYGNTVNEKRNANKILSTLSQRVSLILETAKYCRKSRLLQHTGKKLAIFVKLNRIIYKLDLCVVDFIFYSNFFYAFVML
jgi:hypothetical protein